MNTENIESSLDQLKERWLGGKSTRLFLVRELCKYKLQHNKTYKRSEIINIVKDFCKGAKKPISKDQVILAVRTVIRDTKLFKPVRQGETDRGYYEYIGTLSKYNISRTDQEASTDYIPSGIRQCQLVPDLEPEQTFGDGEYEVYAWCLPLYKKNPDSKGNYPIKIGCAGPEGFEGRYGDVIRELPETPIYLLRFSCRSEQEAIDLERFFRYLLRSKRIERVNGEEWFQTNPETVIGHYEHLVKAQD